MLGFVRPASAAATRSTPRLHEQRGHAHGGENSVDLAAAEAALARLDTDAAEQAFDRLAQSGHVADAELGLVRTHMQRGDYVRAAGLAAHVAGDHPGSAPGRALHAWLSMLIGDRPRAERALGASGSGADSTAVDDVEGRTLLAAAQRAIARPDPIADGRLLRPPARLAPYAARATPPAGARPIANAVLLPDGTTALLPFAAATRPGRMWVVDGLGRSSPVRVHARAAAWTLVRLERPWPLGELAQRAAGDAFPGSVVHAARHAVSAGAMPRWPLLATGFAGAPTAAGRGLAGVVAAPGGPVFDSRGRVVGVCGRADSRSPLDFTLVTAIERVFGAALFGAADAGRPVAGVERVYERALRSALLVVAA